MTLSLRIAILLTVFVAASPATLIVATGSLSGTNENPVNASPATGFTTVTLDDLAHTLHVVVNFTGLLAPNTAAHIHCCVDPPGNISVATTTPTFTGFPSGVTSGSYDHTFDLTLDSSFNAAFVAAHGGTAAQAEADLAAGLVAGQAYLNIHSTLFPGGEIRDFLEPVPEPSTILLFGGGLLALGLFRRRRTSL